MKVVVDTNVLVSGPLSPYGAAGTIARMISAGELSLCYDARVFAEYRDVLTRPRFPFRREEVEDLCDSIEADGELVASGPLPSGLPDPDDEPFLEVALAGGVEFLVTGNLRHFPPSVAAPVRVLSPGEFVRVCRADR